MNARIRANGDIEVLLGELEAVNLLADLRIIQDNFDDGVQPVTERLIDELDSCIDDEDEGEDEDDEESNGDLSDDDDEEIVS